MRVYFWDTAGVEMKLFNAANRKCRICICVYTQIETQVNRLTLTERDATLGPDIHSSRSWSIHPTLCSLSHEHIVTLSLIKQAHCDCHYVFIYIIPCTLLFLIHLTYACIYIPNHWCKNIYSRYANISIFWCISRWLIIIKMHSYYKCISDISVSYFWGFSVSPCLYRPVPCFTGFMFLLVPVGSLSLKISRHSWTYNEMVYSGLTGQGRGEWVCWWFTRLISKYLPHCLVLFSYWPYWKLGYFEDILGGLSMFSSWFFGSFPLANSNSKSSLNIK